MCGIVGIVSPKPELVLEGLRLMSLAVAHRGPDDSGERIVRTTHGIVGLGHRRLAILDLSPLGHQPMGDPSTGNWLSYNGEIYNLRNLRRELESLGYEFRSRTDTEVVLAAYGKWGLKALSRLRGMFALSLWDEGLQRLVLARDPFGIKPLYYCRLGDLLLFGSEVRALLASGLVSRRLSQEGLLSYLQFGSVQEPWTAVEGVRSLSAGHYMLVEARDGMLRVEETPYMDSLSFLGRSPSKVSSRSEAANVLREILEESVRLHLMSDVPLGVFLSGGIDSSALVALMSQVTKETPNTFSVVFAEREFSEAVHGRLVAKRFNTEHREIFLTEENLLERLPAAFGAMDQPTMDAINTYVISKAVKEQGITVALSGLGGDELFAGYPSFNRIRHAEVMAKVPPWMRRVTAAVGSRVCNGSEKQRKAWDFLRGDGSAGMVYGLSRRLFSREDIAAIVNTNQHALSPASWPTPEGGFDDDPVNAMSVLELRGYMANTLLRDTDSMSMANALEVRVPFIDSAVVSYVLGLPGRWKVDGRRPKPLLLDALGDLLPTQIWQRPKMGFTLPFERWMRGALRKFCEERLSPERLGAWGLIRSDATLKFWRAFLDGSHDISWSRLWALVALEEWVERNGIAP